MKNLNWQRAMFWFGMAGVCAFGVYVVWMLHSMAATQDAVLNELRIHTMYIRGAVPVSSDPDRCGR